MATPAQPARRMHLPRESRRPQKAARYEADEVCSCLPPLVENDRLAGIIRAGESKVNNIDRYTLKFH